MRRALAISVIALLAALPFGGGEASAKTKICKNTYGGDFIRAKDVKCDRARAVVRAWGTGYKADGEPNREVVGYNCRATEDPVEGLVMKCTRSGKRITFFANAP
jgi:hypothetical protein